MAARILRKVCSRLGKVVPKSQSAPHSPFREAAPLPSLKQPCLQISGSRACREGTQEAGCAVAALGLGSTSPLEHRRYLRALGFLLPLCMSWYASKVWNSQVAGPHALNSESTFMPKLVCFWEKKNCFLFLFKLLSLLGI